MASLDTVEVAKARLKDMRLENASIRTVSGYRLSGMHVILTDAQAVVEAVDALFDRKSIVGKNCSGLQNRDDPRNAEGNMSIRFGMHVRSPTVVHLINVTPSGHEFINVISIVPKMYTNFHGETQCVGFYSFQFPLRTVTVEKFRPPVPLTVQETFIPDTGELVWFRVDTEFKKGHVVGCLHRTFIVREVTSKYDYCGVEDVWPIDYVESLRGAEERRHWRRAAHSGTPAPLYLRD